jgi:glutathione S-transferase
MPALIIRINIGRVGEAAAASLPRWDAEVALQLTYINGALEGRQFLLGNAFSAADIQLSFAGELAMGVFGLSDYPNIEGWIRRFQARSAYQKALKKGGPYRFAAT